VTHFIYLLLIYAEWAAIVEVSSGQNNIVEGSTALTPHAVVSYRIPRYFFTILFVAPKRWYRPTLVHSARASVATHHQTASWSICRTTSPQAFTVCNTAAYRVVRRHLSLVQTSPWRGKLNSSIKSKIIRTDSDMADRHRRSRIRILLTSGKLRGF